MEPARCIVAFLLDGLSIQLWKCTPAAVRLENWTSNPFAISKESPRPEAKGKRVRLEKNKLAYPGNRARPE